MATTTPTSKQLATNTTIRWQANSASAWQACSSNRLYRKPSALECATASRNVRAADNDIESEADGIEQLLDLVVLGGRYGCWDKRG